jgi:hypothetical protein
LQVVENSCGGFFSFSRVSSISAYSGWCSGQCQCDCIIHFCVAIRLVSRRFYLLVYRYVVFVGGSGFGFGFGFLLFSFFVFRFFFFFFSFVNNSNSIESLVSLLIFFSIFPSFVTTGQMLLQRLPKELERSYEDALLQVSIHRDRIFFFFESIFYY